MGWILKHKLLTAAVAALVAWLLLRKRAAVPRVTKELTIDANVLSPTFGEPIDTTKDTRPTMPTNSIFSRTLGREATIDELNAKAAAALADAADSEDEP